MTAFATPEPTWTAMVAVLDEDTPDPTWALKLAVQCRNHLRHALRHAHGSDPVHVTDPADWAGDPARRAPRRQEETQTTATSRRTGKDVPGGPEGPRGVYRQWHVLLGALIAHEYEQAGRPAPVWTGRLQLEKDWVVSSPQLTEQQVRASTPGWLARRGLFINPNDLAT